MVQIRTFCCESEDSVSLLDIIFNSHLSHFLLQLFKHFHSYFYTKKILVTFQKVKKITRSASALDSCLRKWRKVFIAGDENGFWWILCFVGSRHAFHQEKGPFSNYCFSKSALYYYYLLNNTCFLQWWYHGCFFFFHFLSVKKLHSLTFSCGFLSWG